MKSVSSVCKKVICLFLVASLFWCLCSCDTDYYKQTNWQYTDQEFMDLCFPLYLEKVEALKEVYEIECAIKVDLMPFGADIYLYNENFTMSLFLANRGYCGDCRLELYFYGDDDTLYNYEEQKKYVNFLNDMTIFAAFDTKTENRFDSLFAECLEKNETFASDRYHFDTLIGNVGYDVSLGRTQDSYYYMMKGNSEVKIKSNRYRFEGLLKPFINE